MPRRFFITEVLLLCWASVTCFAKDFEPPQGFIMLHGNGELSESDVTAFAKLAGSEKAKLVILASKENATEPFKKCGAVSLKCAACETVEAMLREATGVWLDESETERIAEKKTTEESRLDIQRELRGVLARGGIVGGRGVAAGILTAAAAASNNEAVRQGLSLLDGVRLEYKTDNVEFRLEHSPGTVTFQLEPKSNLFIHGRTLACGGAPVTVVIGASKTRKEFVQTLRPGQPGDLTTFLRAAFERINPAFPPEKMDPPELKAGTLVIDGGGIPKVALTRFIEAAGGPDALILVCPSAQGDGPPPAEPGEGKLLKRAGAKNVKVFHLATRVEASDEEKIKILREAKGLWFCGGRQWRYVDAYLDTPAEKLMHEILARGGAIGGSSAGATIQGDYLVRGNPLGNVEMMVEGYERGMGFLKGVAVDQHFFKRNRFKDMSSLKKAFPQILGLGLDEGAAIIVTGHTLEVVGVAPIAIYDKREPPKENEKDYVELKPGQKYDLKALKTIE